MTSDELTSEDALLKNYVKMKLIEKYAAVTKKMKFDSSKVGLKPLWIHPKLRHPKNLTRS